MSNNFNLMTKELAATEVFRNDFVRNVSHEFKTPLSAIEGYATLLQNENLNEEKRKMYISKIIYNTKRLSNLTDNVLEISRLENQEILMIAERFSLDEQIREIIILFEKEWSRKKMDINLDLNTINYLGNKELLSQVWQNLITNAIKFSQEHGSIYINMREDLNNVIITSSDDGIGMNNETKKRLFEKFYQGDTSHKTEGNGLGLTLAKRIIDIHKGTIAVESEENKGTTFVVNLPIKEKN